MGEAMTVKITVKPDSNYRVEGDFILLKPDGTEIPHQGQTASLCRCGHSKTKPFCDATHREMGFKSSE
jgi:CDGSH-type Zn-finger protein